jgi:hypothetical protein
MNKTHTGVPDMIITGASVGINTSTPSSNYKLDVNGNINGLILYEGGTSLATTYATITNLNLKENILTFSAPLTRTTNTIGIDLSAYSTTATNNTNYLRLAAATNDLSGKLAILNSAGLNTPQLGDYGGAGDRLILWKG